MRKLTGGSIQAKSTQTQLKSSNNGEYVNSYRFKTYNADNNQGYENLDYSNPPTTTTAPTTTTTSTSTTTTTTTMVTTSTTTTGASKSSTTVYSTLNTLDSRISKYNNSLLNLYSYSPIVTTTTAVTGATTYPSKSSANDYVNMSSETKEKYMSKM